MHLEVRDGVWGRQPRGARVLLGAKGPVESLRDCAEVVCTNRRGCNAVARSQERKKERKKIKNFGTMKTCNMYLYLSINMQYQYMVFCIRNISGILYNLKYILNVQSLVL